MGLNEEPLTTRLIELIQLIIPVALVLLLLFFGLIDTPFTPHAALHVPLFMMAIYYWALFHPHFLPGWFVFTAGLLSDLLTMAPLGLMALLYSVLQKLVISQRTYIINQPFLIIWLIFAALYSLTLLIASWFYPGIFPGIMSDSSIITAIITNMLAFPPVYFLLHLSHKIMRRPAPSPLERSKKKKIILKQLRKGGLS